MMEKYELIWGDMQTAYEKSKRWHAKTFKERLDLAPEIAIALENPGCWDGLEDQKIERSLSKLFMTLDEITEFEEKQELRRQQ